MKQPEVQRQSIRSRMPTVAAIFDEFRGQFPEARLLYGKENGLTLGERNRDENAFTLPPSYRTPFAPAKKENRK